MAARPFASQVIYLPSVVDEGFLGHAVEALERLRVECELRGHSLLGSLLAITKGEAEDCLRTQKVVKSIPAPDLEQDDGAEEMAQKFAYRGRGAA